MVFSVLIALYLFLGGTAAGGFAIIALVDLLQGLSLVRTYHGIGMAMRMSYSNAEFLTHKRISRLVYALSFAMLIFGLGCLLADLGRPEVFYWLFMMPTWSLISKGTFALAALSICMMIALADAFLDRGTTFRMVALVSKLAGFPLALFVMSYTGMLLKAVLAVHLWQSPWLPVLFISSALSCGCGLVLLCCFFSDDYRRTVLWKRFFSQADLICIVLEILAVGLFVYSVYHTHGIDPLVPLLFSATPWLFWGGFMLCGIVIPLGMELRCMVSGTTLSHAAAGILACMVLFGGICLRFALVNAGFHIAF